MRLCKLSYQKWSKEGRLVNLWKGHEWPSLSDAHREQRLACVVRSIRKATAEIVNAGSDIKGPKHFSLFCVGLFSCRLFRVPMLTLVHHQKCLQWAQKHQNWKVAWSNESGFLSHDVDGCVYKALGNVLLGNMGPSMHVEVTLTCTTITKH